jgi:hypothetical protein
MGAALHISPELRRAVTTSNAFWQAHFEQALQQGVGFHLAILVQPYLRLLLDGQKTIESRFSVNRSAPFDRVQAEDIVFFKLSGGPILGVGVVDNAQFYRITPNTLHHIRKQFAKALCITDAAFWDTHAQASFASLLHLRCVARIEPTPFYKRDRRGWVVLHPRAEQHPLWHDDAGDAGSAIPLSADQNDRFA